MQSEQNTPGWESKSLLKAVGAYDSSAQKLRELEKENERLTQALTAQTERLNFLLRFITIEDVDSEPTVVVSGDAMENWIQFSGPTIDRDHVESLNDDLRDVIDRALKAEQQNR